ncbi:MAG: hypothetical protein ACFB51_05570 [Anaerolineae bacterium]
MRRLLVVLTALLLGMLLSPAASLYAQEGPTPTLLPPPAGGGVVTVSTLVVRIGPDQSWGPLGALAYNTEVFPVGRNFNGTWVAIEWTGEREIGWIAAGLVSWDPSLDLLALPELEAPPLLTPTPAVGTATPTVEPSSTPAPTDEPSPTATDAPEPTEAAATTAPEPMATPTPTATQEAIVVPPEAEEPPASTQEPPAVTLPPEAGLWAGVGLLFLAILAYAVRFVAGRRERSRYADGFVLEACPVCQIGMLELDEVSRQTLGLVSTRRSVRCDTCRSVMRQIRPGTWRYNMDALFNPALADEYSGRQFSDKALLTLAEDAHANYEPEIPQEEAAAFPSPEEVIAELEARFEAETRAQQEAEHQEMDDTSAADEVEENSTEKQEAPPVMEEPSEE